MGLSTVEGLKEVSAAINETLQKEEITMPTLRSKFNAPKAKKHKKYAYRYTQKDAAQGAARRKDKKWQKKSAFQDAFKRK